MIMSLATGGSSRVSIIRMTTPAAGGDEIVNGVTDRFLGIKSSGRGRVGGLQPRVRHQDDQACSEGGPDCE